MKNSTILVPCKLEKQDCLLSVIPLTTELRCLNCVESLLQSLEVSVVREESLCFQFQQQIPLMQRDIVTHITSQSP